MKNKWLILGLIAVAAYWFFELSPWSAAGQAASLLNSAAANAEGASEVIGTTDTAISTSLNPETIGLLTAPTGTVATLTAG